jgi:hypothetical protein
LLSVALIAVVIAGVLVIWQPWKAQAVDRWLPATALGVHWVDSAPPRTQPTDGQARSLISSTSAGLAATEDRGAEIGVSRVLATHLAWYPPTGTYVWAVATEPPGGRLTFSGGLGSPPVVAGPHAYNYDVFLVNAYTGAVVTELSGYDPNLPALPKR